MRRFLFTFLLLLPAVLFTGCSRSVSNQPPREFPVSGEVLKLDTTQRIATIRHQKIEGWMEAMTMEFPVRDGEDLRTLQPGNQIQAKVFVEGLNFSIGAVRQVPPSP